MKGYTMKLFPDNHCLICHEKILTETSWGTLFSPEKVQLLCYSCNEQFETIEGEICRICSRPFENLEDQFRHGDLCHDCYRWEGDPEWQGSLGQNTSIYLYNDFLKEVMAKYKFRGDYALAKIFADKMKDYLHKINPDILIPIPLSEERLYERGFNQVEALIHESGYQSTNILSRIHSEKQSKKSRNERIHIPQVFQVEAIESLVDKKVLLIDDIYTTGSTLRHAAKLLKAAGADRIHSLTLAR
jgi:competence protein ComFC